MNHGVKTILPPRFFPRATIHVGEPRRSDWLALGHAFVNDCCSRRHEAAATVRSNGFSERERDLSASRYP